MTTLTSDSMINKAMLAVMKLQDRENWRMWSITMCLALDHTWEYVRGSKVTPPPESSTERESWLAEDQAARRRIFLALSDEVKETVLHLVDCQGSRPEVGSGAGTGRAGGPKRPKAPPKGGTP